MVDILNFYFPNDYLFNILDPNGGLWIKKIINQEFKFILGFSSVIAEKLEKLDFFKVLNEKVLIKHDIFAQLKGLKYEISFFSPFKAQIDEINPILKKNTILTQNSVYKEHWMLKLTINDFDMKNWFSPNNEKLSKYVSNILKADKRLQEKCCPNFSLSGIVRRKK